MDNRLHTVGSQNGFMVEDRLYKQKGSSRRPAGYLFKMVYTYWHTLGHYLLMDVDQWHQFEPKPTKWVSTPYEYHLMNKVSTKLNVLQTELGQQVAPTSLTVKKHYQPTWL